MGGSIGQDCKTSDVIRQREEQTYWRRGTRIRRQKKYIDLKAYVKEHQDKNGNKILMERKPTKNTTPYTVVRTHGSQISAEREGLVKTRDAQKFKRVR